MWAVVVAAGAGERFGGRAKQFELLGGRPVASWSIEAARSVAGRVVLVVPPTRTEEPSGDPGPALGADIVVAGGLTRSASVRRGLAVVPPSATMVVVHDAARPLARPALFHAVIDALADDAVDGAICATSVSDTLKRLGTDRVTVAGTVDRSGLVAVQTPQAFRADVLRRAHEAGEDATDDAALVEAVGGTVRVVPGDPRNLKLTVPADLDYAEHLLAEVR
ncbi:MAG: 2-C-methyl-D-erythritol 4-phosphate cytidylyltransferase [Acidimicrobiales bacterium]